MITLYGMSSPNVRKPAILLDELGLDYRLVHVGVMRGRQFDAAFAALNPLRKVPVLVEAEGAPPLFESGAILIHLAEKHGRFLPAAAGPARDETFVWLMVQMAQIGPMFGQYNHFRFLPESESVYARARYRAQAETLYRALDDRLSARDWLAGGAYSIADIATWPWATYLEPHGFDPAGFPALVRWRDAIAARPAVQRANARFAEAFGEADNRDRRAASAEELDLFFGRTADMPAADYSAIAR
jgi:GST-like protein